MMHIACAAVNKIRDEPKKESECIQLEYFQPKMKTQEKHIFPALLLRFLAW